MPGDLQIICTCSETISTSPIFFLQCTKRSYRPDGGIRRLAVWPKASGINQIMYLITVAILGPIYFITAIFRAKLKNRTNEINSPKFASGKSYKPNIWLMQILANVNFSQNALDKDPMYIHF